MRRALPVVLLLIMLFLSACGGGGPTPTETPEPPTAAPTSDAPTQPPLDVFALPTGLNEVLEIPPAGTMFIAQLEEDGVIVTREPYIINLISYYQQGGITGATQSIVLYGDGRMIRDGVESTVSAEDIASIAAMLEEIQFLDIQGIFDMGGQGADQFRYSLTVETPQGSRTINTVDGMTPAPLHQLFDAIKALAS